MKKIKLTQGKYAIINDSDFDLVNKYKWIFTGYACANAKKGRGNNVIRMHRLITNVSRGEIVDHKNGNKIDNRKSNLRICSMGENKMNQNIYKNNTSGFKGVHLRNDPRTKIKKWQARISFNNNRISIGYFTTAVEAAFAYNIAAIKFHGEFAKLNAI